MTEFFSQSDEKKLNQFRTFYGTQQWKKQFEKEKGQRREEKLQNLEILQYNFYQAKQRASQTTTNMLAVSNKKQQQETSQPFLAYD